ncbi:MAG: 7-carboxy-7-deazaguanine synthase QueE [Microcoleaceae cyanobacterium MO_207.B10]|nr:7-carboxy-7-deazaguanine synthase QueE [Microcoleaceae cyanobacterium MO_207.B10]
MTENLTIPIHETFQKTVQGEGYWAGVLVDFIRLAGCPVGCHYCDTGYADGGIGLPRQLRSFDELIDELFSPRVVISGGEPFIHKQLPALVKKIEASSRKVSIETSGCYWQNISSQAWITLSPKQHISPKYPVLPQMWERANEIKLVIETGKELEFYSNLFLSNNNIPVFLQPEWYSRERTIPLVLELLQKYPHYRLSLQLHKYVGLQ